MAVVVGKTDPQIAALAPVQSVAGMTGDVTLTTSDVSGLGTIATQAASNVAITGGSVTGITDLAVADGGTGASNASDARTNLGLVIGTDVLSPTGSGAGLTGITQSQVAGLTSALSAKADLVGGVIPSSQIPSVAIAEFLGSVSSQSAMTALSGQKGDWCIRTDTQMAYFIVGDDPTNAANWTAIPHPSSPVLTVNGQTGTVVLGYGDVGAQPDDATLTALAGVSTAANKLIYATGSDAFSTTDFTSAARSLLDDADVAAMRATLGVAVSNNNWFDSAPAVGTVTWVAKSRVAFTIGGVYGVKTTTGTCTFAVKINGTAVTGLSAVAATTSTQDVTASGGNSVAAGDVVTIEYTAASSPANLSFTLEATR